MMKKQFISRRKFIRLAGISSVSALMAACGQQPSPTLNPTVTGIPTEVPPTPPPAPTPTTAAVFSLAGGDAEIWDWEKKVSGQIQNLACEAVQIRLNDQTLQAEADGEAFTATLPLNEGENQVSAACQPAGEQAESLTYTVGLRNTPVSNIEIQLENGQVVVDGSASQPAPRNGDAVRAYRWSVREANPAEITIQSPEDLAGQVLSGEVDSPRLVFVPPEADGEYYLNLTVVDESGRSDTSTTYFRIANGQAVLDDWSWQNTEWIESAVVYGVIPRNFANKAFEGIIDRLDELQDLGVTALWLAPVHPSPIGDYGYAVVDYFELRPQYGSKDDFRRMVQEAHRRGIRILMDLVPNHSSDEHRYFQDMLKYGMDSHYWEFYDHDETGAPTHYFDWTNLPNLNYDNPEVEQWMIEASAYWVREFDIDGFRVDVAWGIRERKPDFWPKWRQALKRIKPDVLLLAEASARDDYYFTEGFDVAYDWTSQLGHWAWELVFEDTNLLTYNLDAALTNVQQGFHEDALIFRFINNNDTGQRFISRHGLEMTRVATALLLTLPGIPCIYTGDDVGEVFLPYGDPWPITWDDPHGLFDYHKQLVHLRRDTPALHSREWQIVDVEPRQQVYGYVRHIRNQPDNQPVLVLLNFFDQENQVEVQLPEGFEAFANQPLQDLLSGELVQVSGSGPLTVTMQPYSSLLLTPAQA